MLPANKLHTIYALRCKNNGKLYIGRTTRLEERIKSHFWDLKSGRHTNKLLLKDYKKYGSNNFEVYVLERNVPYSEREKEFDYMRVYNTFDEEYGYNQGDKKHQNQNKLTLIFSLPPNKYEKSNEKITEFNELSEEEEK